MNKINWQKKITTCLSVVTISCLSVAPLAAKPASKNQTINPLKSATFYQKAKQELPEDFYVIYRIVDRIARANNIDNTPWRVVVVNEYNINAFATDVNLIALYTGILDQLAGDSSGIACVVGHEMAHHIKRHIALSPVQEAEAREQIRQEAEAEVEAEVKDAKSDVNSNAVGSTLFRTIGLGSVSGILENDSRQRVAKAEQRVQEIVKQKEKELNERLAANSRTHEFEADEQGYQYMAKAGFEPEGCLRVMNVLGRTPGAEFDTSHPAIPKRIEQLKELMAKYPATQLAEEGRSKISASQPLTYDLSKDGRSLRINSRRGGSAADNLEQLFD